MASYRPNDIFYTEFTVANISGIAVNADSAPLGTLFKNGIDDLTPKVFVTNIDTGRYTVSGLIPSTYSKGSSIGVVVSGYVNGALSKLTTNLGVLDTYLLGDGVVLASSGIDNVITEVGVNARQALSIMSAVLAGSSTTAGNNITYYAINNQGTTRVQSTAVSGARQALVIFLPA